MNEKTLAIVKPDAVKKRIVGKIITRIEEEGFKILGMRMVHLTGAEAQGFYAVHKSKPFYGSLTEFMTSGEVVVLALEGDNAVSHWRQVMGETDPSRAKEGTLRRSYGFSIERNAVHGSDSLQNAEIEIRFFFKDL